MNILLVEDQQRLAQALVAILENEGYHVDAVSDGRSGLEYALGAQRTKTPYDLVILDVMLPVMDGFAVTRELRRTGSDVPIIMLTARDTLADKISGLDVGADDYLTKPFQPAELLARLRALTRRSGPVHVERIVLGNTSLDLLSAELRRTEEGAGAGAAGVGAAGAAKVGTEATATRKAGEEGVHLSQREFELCRLLMAHPKQTLTKANLLARVWGLDTSADENNVEIYISFLRKKLSYLQSNLSIITVRGMGYRLEVPGTGASEVAESTEGKSAATAEPGATPASPTEPVAPAPPTTPLTTPTPPQTGNPHAH